MYYVNFERIAARRAFISTLIPMLQELLNHNERQSWSGTLALAQERALHLAIEVVTDIGSDLIDGYMMRDAGSYEDIIEILADEQVLDRNLASRLAELVRLRKSLLQEYMDLERERLHALIPDLPADLRLFSEQVDAFLQAQPKLYTK